MIKKRNKKFLFFSGLKLYSDVFKAGPLVSLSNEKHLMRVLYQVGRRMAIITLLSTRETNRFTLIHNFGQYLIRLHKHHGSIWVIKYLKACQLAVQKKIAGQPFKSLREIEPDLNLPRLTTSGLPCFIKLGDRRAISVGSVRIIRFWLSLFSIYRILKCEFKPKLNTITDPFIGEQQGLDGFNKWLSDFHARLLITKILTPSLGDLAVKRILPLFAAGSLGKPSYMSMLESWELLKKESLGPIVKEYATLTKSVIFLSFLSNFDWLSSIFQNRSNLAAKYQYLGRLAFKEEAAGKLRVFAMVDVITQSLLEPLHKWLFTLFKRLPNDSTHDQEKAFRYAQSLNKKWGKSFGFDLSSATDRLPVSSQIALLNNIFQCNIGSLWGSLLTQREYWILENKYGLPEGPLKYSVGQPMGALSSWDMLNLIHHMMVQFAAHLLHKADFGVWYDQYVVLGDDIVIFDPDIASFYQNLCKALGVEINLSKSVCSNIEVLEFAKRTSYKGSDVSAISFKEMLQGNNFFGKLALASRLVRRSYGKDIFLLFKLANLNPDSSHDDLKYPIVGYLTQLYSRGLFSFERLLSLLTSKDYPLSFFGRKIHWMKVDKAMKVLKAVLTDPVDEKSLTSIFDHESLRWSNIKASDYKIILIRRLFNLMKKIRDIKPSILSRDIRFHWMTTQAETSFFQSFYDNKIAESFELAQPRLSKRSYAKKIPFEKEKDFLDRIFLYLLDPSVFINKDVNFRSLRLGFDVDLSRTALNLSLRWVVDNLKIVEEDKFDKEIARIVKTESFADWRVEDLLKHEQELIKLWSAYTCFFMPRLNKKDAVIDNPLKVLDFIKDLNDPKLKPKVKPDFMKMNDGLMKMIFDTTLPSGFDLKPGFKPRIRITIAPDSKMPKKGR